VNFQDLMEAMMPFVRGTAVTLFALVGLAATAAMAADVKSLGDHPTPDQLIEALVPATGVNSGAMETRGLRVYSAKAETASQAPAPAVALDIKFGLNSAELTPQAKASVQQLAAAMKSQQLLSFRFRVEGHTDASGSPEHNLILSKERAQSVSDYLVRQFGIDPSRLQIVGRGQQDPLDPADPRNAVNRRVQIVNLGG
jgi:OOP family OmpA-OmpF porin